MNQSADTHTDNPKALAHFLGISQICTWGAFYYAFPLIAVVMHSELGWSKSDLYGALTVGHRSRLRTSRDDACITWYGRADDCMVICP